MLGISLATLNQVIKYQKTLHKDKILNRDKGGRQRKTKIKMKDLDNGMVEYFSSFAEAATRHKTTSSHIFQAIPRNNKFKLFRKKYLVAYQHSDFLNAPPSVVSKARLHGSRRVTAFNKETKVLLISPSARSFYKNYGLSKKISNF